MTSMNEFAARPFYAASAVRVFLLGLGVIASLAAGKAMLEQGLTTPAMAEPAAPTAAAKVATAQKRGDLCRQVEVEIDGADGVRGRVVRVCRKPF